MCRTIQWAKICFLFFVTLIMMACSRPQRMVNDGFGDYLLVSAGTFSMGDHFDEGNSDEIPVHDVYLDAYYIGKFKITNGEYQKFIEDGGYTRSEYWLHGGFGEYGSEPTFWREEMHRGGGIPGNQDYPVVGVSWFEAMAYCQWLSNKTVQVYRLPTEAEWEKAARGTGKLRYGWGNELDKHSANYDYGQPRGEMSLTLVGYYDGTERDGTRTLNRASPYGAYDMIGNVTEWCADWYDANYYRNSPKGNPRGPETGVSRVLRSGGYVDSAYYQRASSRHKRGAHMKNYKTGFRCVREL